MSISELEYQELDIREERLHFSELLDIISGEIARTGLQQVVELSEKYGLSVMIMDDISAEVRAVRNEKRSY